MLGLTRKDWTNLLPVLLLFAFVSTFRSGASGLIDPDEPFYALTAREMLQRGDWITPTLFGQPQFEKPVFAYWAYMAFFRLFGIHEWSARLASTAAAFGVLVSTAVLAKALFRRSRAVLLSTVVLASSGLFITLSRVVLTDMFLCLFTTAAFAAFAAGWKNQAVRPIAWRLFFAFMGLAVLTKGPIGLLLPFGSVLLCAAFFRREIARSLPWASGLAVFAAVAVPWYLLAAARNDWFLNHFLLHENVRRFFVAEHKSMNTPYFYPCVLLFGFFPWSFPLVSALQSQISRLDRGAAALRASRAFLLVSSAAMFAFFAAASSKLISYIFPLFPLLAVLTGDWLDRLIPALRRFAPSAALRASLFAGWVVLPAALVGGVVWYEVDHDLGLWKQVLTAGLLAVVPGIAAYALFMNRKLRASLAVTAGLSAAFSLAAFGWIMPMVERYFSSRPMIEDFEHDGFDPAKGTLLASKISVRGVSYYAGNPSVAVVTSNPRKAFYTPHPIPTVASAGDLDKISPGHYPVYGILRAKEIRLLGELAGPRYGLRVLDANAQRSIVRIERREIG